MAALGGGAYASAFQAPGFESAFSFLALCGHVLRLAARFCYQLAVYVCRASCVIIFLRSRLRLHFTFSFPFSVLKDKRKYFDSILSTDEVEQVQDAAIKLRKAPHAEGLTASTVAAIARGVIARPAVNS